MHKGIPPRQKNVFNPSSIKDSNGNKLLLQQLLTKQRPTIGGIVYDERSNKGTARSIQLGRCYLFDGTNDYVSLPSNLDMALSGATLRVVLTFTYSTDGRILFSKGGALGGYFLWVTGNKLSFQIRQAGSSSAYVSITGSTTLTVGTTYAIDVTFTETGATGTINGVTETFSATAPTGTYGDASFAPHIGTREGLSLTHHGKMWGIKLYKNGTLQAFYKCDEQLGLMVYDSSGNGKHGLILNATLATFHSTQDIYSYQNEVGYSPYIRHSDTASYYSSVFSGGTTNATIRFKFISTDTSGVIVHDIGSASRYALVFTQGSALTALNQGCGTPTYTIDGVLFTGTTRGELYTALCDGKKHDVVISNLNLSTWTNITVGGYAGVTLTGIVFDLSVEKTTGTTSHSWKFYGDTPATDTVGSSNMVASGTFETVLIPRNEVNTTLDALGSTLQYTGQVPYNALLKQSNCIDLDGANDYISVGAITPITGDWTAIIDVNPDDNTTLQYMMALTGTINGNISIAGSSGWFFYDGASILGNIGGNLPTGAWTQIAVVKSGTTYTLYENGVSDNTGIRADIDISTVDIGRRGDAMFYSNSKVRNAKIYNKALNSTEMAGVYSNNQTILESLASNLVLHLPMSEGNGTKTYDMSPNNYHGTLMNGALWVKQDSYHYNLLRGFEYYDDDATHTSVIRVPYKLDGSKVTPTISGYSKIKDCPAGAYHNGAETTIDMSGGVASPVAVLGSWTSAWSFNTARTNPKFKRTLTLSSVDYRADRFLAYREVLTGTNLTKVQSYTATKAV